MERKKALDGIKFDEPATFFCHPAHDDEQQQLLQQQQQHSNTQNSSSNSGSSTTIYKCMSGV